MLYYELLYTNSSMNMNTNTGNTNTNISNNLVDNIKTWVQYDSQLKILSEKSKEIREKKGEIQTMILEQLKTKNMEKTVIEIGDGELKMVSKKEYPSLTFQYIEGCLTEIIPNPEHVNYIIEYLKSHREIKDTIDLRRIYKKI
jgi:hypothetical protein